MLMGNIDRHYRRLNLVRWGLMVISLALFSLGLLIVGVLTLFTLVAPDLKGTWPPLPWLLQGVSVQSSELNAFLAADITAISVLVAIVIAQGVGLLRDDSVPSPDQDRKATLAFILFFAACAINLVVALFELLRPPAFDVQILLLFVWFLAILILTIYFLLTLVLRNSLAYQGYGIIDELRHIIVELWEQQAAYNRLLLLLLVAFARRELGVVSRVAELLGYFLTTRGPKEIPAPSRDEQGRKSSTDNQDEPPPQDDRADFRAIENLLTAATDGSLNSPAATQALGRLIAGALLAGVAHGLHSEKLESNLFRRVFRTLRRTSDRQARIASLLAGMRFALCRPSGTDAAYLLVFIGQRKVMGSWVGAVIGNAVGSIYQQSWPLFRDNGDNSNSGDADLIFVQALLDFYRDFVDVFVPSTSRRSEWFSTFALGLLQAVRDTSAKGTDIGGTAGERLKNGYTRYENHLKSLLGVPVAAPDA